MIRLYQSGPLQLGQPVTLDKEAYHHLTVVLRARVGEKIIVFNGLGGEYQGELVKLDKKFALIHLTYFNDIERESPLFTHLAQGLTRGEKMDWIIQKAVELGVNRITPLYTERSLHLDKNREANRVAHWQKVAISACEQSGRTRLPLIDAPQPLLEFLNTNKDLTRYVLAPTGSHRLPQPALSLQGVRLVIGPEGGLSEREIEQAITSGCQPLQLGSRILRTETAPIVALSLLQFTSGDI